MRILSLLILFITSTSLAQVKGNGEIVSQNYNLDGILEVSVQLYAKVTIDPSAEAGMTITGDSNLLPLIGRDFQDGKLTLDQIEWIKPSQDLIIKIGAPDLKAVEHGTHDETYIINLNQDRLDVSGNVGKIILSGKVDQLNINSKLAKINAADLTATNANVVITGRGSAIVKVTQNLVTDLDGNATLEVLNEPESVSGNYKPSNIGPRTVRQLTYVNFTLKNNSWNRNHFYVEGPNPDGTSFSYGFPIMPGFTRAERWSVGTKVYLDKKLGKRELLYTVTAADEGETVKLFE